MKVMGHTDEHGAIVEFSRREWIAIQRAINAANGLTVSGMDMAGSLTPERVPDDMSRFFTALTGFCNTKFHIVELKNFVDNLSRLLDQTLPEDPPHDESLIV